MKIAAGIAAALFALVAILLVSQGWYVVTPAAEGVGLWRVHKITGEAQICSPRSAGDVSCITEEKWWLP